jgi:hypothetical protein
VTRNGDNDRLYNPDNWGCGPSVAAVLIVVFLLGAGVLSQVMA